MRRISKEAVRNSIRKGEKYEAKKKKKIRNAEEWERRRKI